MRNLDEVKAPDVAVSGLLGATALAPRHVGGTANGPPTAGTFTVGDSVISATGHTWVCVVAGSPGTWVDTGAVGAAAVQRLLVVGHSYTVGQGAPEADYGCMAKVAAYFDADLSHLGVGGSLLGWDATTSAGGYTGVLQSVVPNRSAAPYLPEPWLPLILSGINDLGYGKNTPPYQQALRTVISRAMAARVFENDDASVTYPSGTWAAATTRTDLNSGTGDRALSSATGSIQIAVPSDFEGGAVAIGFVANPSAVSVPVSITVDGSAETPAGISPTNLQGWTYTSGAAHYNGIVVRLTGLTAGAHTIVVSFTGNSNGASVIFDYWQIEGSNPPPAFVANIARLLTAGYAVYPATVPTDADVATWNTAIAAAIAEFSHVHLVDIDTAMGKAAANFAADGVHPNERGHNKIAAAFVDAINLWVPQLTTEQVMQAVRKPPSTQNHLIDRSNTGTNIALNATSWTMVPTPTTGRPIGGTIEAGVGDTLEFTPMMFVDASGTAYALFDVAVCDASNNPIRYWSSRTSTPLALGWTPWFCDASLNRYVGISATYQVQKGDILDVGHVRLRLFYKLGAASTRNLLQGSTDNLIAWMVKNLGKMQATP